MQQTTQVLVIGGGPAGSTAATLLAREGFEVTLLERAVFPRYHIGESLLPSCLEILDMTGAREKVEAHGFQRKDGGYFDWGKDAWELDFTKLRHPYSFQVVRSEFDHILLEHAKSQGVKVFEGIEVQQIFFHEDRPYRAAWSQVQADTGEKQTGEISFDYLIDASGRTGMMSMRYLKGRHYHNAFQNVAVWGYWTGTTRMDFAPYGAIAVGAIPDGWIWGIPLHDGTMSIGLVLHKTTFKEKRQQNISVEQIYFDAIKGCTLITDLVKHGECATELKTEQDYSYMSDRLTGPGYFLAGDSACFIDPLLSTGVHLATHSAMMAAASLASILRGERTEEQAMRFYDQSYRHAYLRLIVIVSALYQQYNGEPTYFWHAQQLTHQDYQDSTALNEAFLYVVSGMEDLKDSENAQQGHSLENMADQLPQEQRTMIAQQAYHKVFWRSSISPETAIEGMYVVTKPHLGLAAIQNTTEVGTV